VGQGWCGHKSFRPANQKRELCLNLNRSEKSYRKARPCFCDLTGRVGERENSIMSLLSSVLRSLAALGVVAAIGSYSAQAVPILPGQTLPVVGEADPTGGTIISNSGSALNSAFSGGTGVTAFSGTLISKVIKNDPSNILGGLTFTYQLTNAAGSQTALSRLTTDDFTGFLTDVSFQTPAGGTAPASVDRNTAAVMGWTYSAAAIGQVAPGSSSAVMVVQTNAQAFNNVTGNVLAGAGTTAATYGAAVPEPVSLALLAMGGMFVRRRRA